MKNGLYELVVNTYISKQLETVPGNIEFENLEVVDSHQYLAQYMYKVLAASLSQVRAESNTSAGKDRHASKISNQIKICNEIVQLLIRNDISEPEQLTISPQAQRLMQILASASKSKIERPDTPLALGALLTGTRQDPSLISQLQKEIISADRIDILCSFIKWSGIRILQDFLKTFTNRDNTKLRIITTSYMGATDYKAIDFLQKLPKTEIKVSYDTHRTRLHAKSYLFHRDSNFGCAYIGSANISHAALTDGLEWNIKISQYEQPYQWERATGTFETYWNDSEFELLDTQKSLEQLKKALAEEIKVADDYYCMPNFDLIPYGFQQEILDCLQAEREIQLRKKHLVVAATGTGKTMIAAFDFKQWTIWREKNNVPHKPKLLFVAHRQEILKQSLATFRAVLRDQNFGELMYGGLRPESIDQLFISIQTYNSQNLTKLVEAGHYDYVVIDEFHHAAAESYQELLSHIEPECLLGLTATPERADGIDVFRYFDNHISAEIRLPDAINRKLLSPFQYFGISDSVDYSSLKWQRGGYNLSELDGVLTGNDIRANLIIEKTISTVLDINKTRGLGFCVSKAHSEFMSQKFNNAGIPSDFLTADSGSEHRKTIQKRLIDKEINFIFVVDLYNEGVDIPQVDTVLFLRPTESLTIFLQQLGRGLRLCDGKDCLTVLDFIGQAHKNYRFDIKMNALLNNPSYRLKQEIQDFFPSLPAGCSIQLEKQASYYILDSISKTLSLREPEIINKIASFVNDSNKELSLLNFMEFYNLTFDDIYKKNNWSRLCVMAQVKPDFEAPNEDILTKGLRRINHLDDVEYIDFIIQTLERDHQFQIDQISEKDRRRIVMLYYTVWQKYSSISCISEIISKLKQNTLLCNELVEILRICRNRIATVTTRMKRWDDCPLMIHAKYTRNEILAGLGRLSLERQDAMREGVLYIPEINCDVFFITLNKNEKHYSPTTMYEDYAISEDLFHWQSQSTTSDTCATGQRYINHNKNSDHTILLCVRENTKTSSNLAEPFNFLGPANYVTHRGSKPISITWRLQHKIPSHLMRKTARLVAK